MSQVFPYALGVAVSPIPIGAALVILSGPGALTNSLWFASGWIVGVAIAAGTLTVAVAALDVTNSKPAVIAVLDLALGLAFVLVAVRLWAGPTVGHRTERWLRRVDHLTPRRCGALGAVLSAANPKVLALALGAAVSVAKSSARALPAVGGAALFVAVGSLGVVLPAVAYAARPARGAQLLGRLRGWLAVHERAILTVLSIGIAALFIQSGLSALN